jgi:plastocyanin
MFHVPRSWSAIGLVLLLGCLDSQGPANVNGGGLGPAVNGTGASTTSGTGANHRVNVGDNFFAPDTLTIAVSDTVTWSWSGLNPHSVTFGDGVGSGVRTSGSFQRFFGAAGSFPYTSTLTADSLMRGVIVVR